ncbi:hypothetical protein GGG16DRAFT_106966, partial [Schizophyllum commune]
GKAEDSLSPFISFIHIRICIRSVAFYLNPDFMLSSYSHQATSTTSEARVVVLATTTRRTYQHRASSSSQSASPYSPGGLGSHDPPDATDLFLPIPIPSSLSTTSRSTVAVTRGRILVDIGNILRYWVPNYRLTRYLTPRPRPQTCPFETATCGARRAAALVDAHTDGGLNARESAEHNVKPLSFIPDVVIRGSAAVPGVNEGVIRLSESSRQDLGVIRYFCRFWTAGGARSGSLGEFSLTSNRRRQASASSVKDARGGVPLLLARVRERCRGLKDTYLICDFSRTSNRRRHARAPSVKDARGVGYPYLLIMNMITEGLGYPYPSREPESVAAPPCAHGLLIFADLQPPEARARILGEGCERGGVPPTPHAALLRAQKSGGTAPFVEGSSLLVPRRGQVRPQRLRVPVHAKEKVYTYEGGMP